MERKTFAPLFVGFVLVSAVAFAAEAPPVVAAAGVVDDIRPQIPQESWTRAHCVIVLPGLKKAAFIVGGEYGKGVMSCRVADGWTAPLFVELARGSWGVQAGAEQIDLVLLVMNESGVEKLLRSKVTLGADVSVAAGPVGRSGTLATDAAFSAEILAYSRSKGLFAGINVSGGVLRPDQDVNRATYGPDASPRRILATREISAATDASAFLRALAGGRAAPASSAAQTGRAGDAEPRSPAHSPSDQDFRTQLLDLRHGIDLLLADTVPLAVGTAGGRDEQRRPGVVAVDRARLVQIRQQIEALITALDRR
jgi:lipid-binding SYLF domain-containing protein